MSDETPEWVRVRQPETGHHFTAHRTVVEANPGLVPLKSAAVNANGDPLPDKPRVDKGSTRSETTAAATEKES